MRRTIFAVALLLITAVPAFAVTRTVMVVDDVIRMSKAGVADAEIIAFVRKSAQPFEIDGDDVIAMQEAHVSQAVMKFVIDESAAQTLVYVSPGIYSPWYDPFYYGWFPYCRPYDYGPGAFIGFGFGFGGYRGGFRGGHGGHVGGGHRGGGGHHGHH